MRYQISRFSPALVSLCVLLIYLSVVYVQGDYNPLTFVRIGEKYQVEDAVDVEGYDGQFVYFIARELEPEAVSSFLDVPAYRYQRILLPLLARILSFGQPGLLPWSLIAVGVLSQFFGVYVVSRLLDDRGVSKWYALIYGLWSGFLLAVRLDLPEPLAFLLIGLAIYMEKRRAGLAWVLFGLAVFAKEVALLFVAGQVLYEILMKKWGRAFGLMLVSILPFAIFQWWLRGAFGSYGIGSGGAMATGFEWIPFMGWFRISGYSWLLFALYGLILVPFIYFPAVWSIRKSIEDINTSQRAESMYLFANALVIPFLPFSTVREPAGILRFFCGFILAFLVFSAKTGKKKSLNYAVLWIVLSLVIFNM